jgi:hypothetical protein
LTVLLLGGSLWLLVGVAASTPSAEERAVETIRRDAAIQGPGPALPLAASWNDGSVSTGFGPDYQIEEIRNGQYLLPWFTLAMPGTHGSGGLSQAGEALYYDPAIRYLAEHHLPLSFESTQWERLLPQVSPQYPQEDALGHAPPVSPYGPLDPWYSAGRAWSRHEVLQRLQKLYPDPPRVVFISNNEYPKLSPNDLHAGDGENIGAAAVARRRAIGDAWIERYTMLLRGFRDGLTAPAWRENAVFIGYDAFMSAAIGRWGGWLSYSLYVPGRSEPWPYAWDGASVSYYVHDWAPDADFTVWSPEVEAMNYIAVLDEVRRAKPSFWFEISVWDGQQPGAPTDKREFYAARGQELTPERYGGMVQFGMWLLRPRVVREFRNPDQDRLRFGPYFDEILAAVARVHDEPTLRSFWLNGRLLENPVAGHPYQTALPRELAARPRWFMLDSSVNPPRPWELTTSLRVFALALEQGKAPNRQWLIFAFAPLEASVDTVVKIPGGPSTAVRAARAGAFTIVAEGQPRPQQIG